MKYNFFCTENLCAYRSFHLMSADAIFVKINPLDFSRTSFEFTIKNFQAIYDKRSKEIGMSGEAIYTALGHWRGVSLTMAVVEDRFRPRQQHSQSNNNNGIYDF